MIQEDVILSRGLTLLEKISDVNSLKALYADSYTCLVVRLNSFSLTKDGFDIETTQSSSNIRSQYSIGGDGILTNQVTNSIKSLLLIHMPVLYNQSIGGKGWQRDSYYECVGFKIYNSEDIKLLPSYEFLKGNFAGVSFNEHSSSVRNQLESSQSDILAGVGLRAFINDNTTYLQIIKTYERLITEGSSGIKTGQFIL